MYELEDADRLSGVSRIVKRRTENRTRIGTEQGLAPRKYYPVATLPNEIVSEIFIQFLPVYPLCPPSIGSLSPTHLTHICRTWRDIALATLVLWRAITLSLNDLPMERQALVSDILRRSGCCPLSIQLDEFADEYEYDDDDEDNDPKKAMEILALAVPHSARWEYLKANLLYPHFLPIDFPMPLLRHLDLGLTAEDEPVNDDSMSFRELPSLCTVILDDAAIFRVVLPWDRLTSLTLTRVMPEDCPPVLRRASNLVYCELRLCCIYPHAIPLPDVTLPCLESLVFWDPVGSPTPRYLETFVVPALRRLVVPERFLQPNPIGSLTSFISKSGCKLKDVCITGDGLVASSSYRQACPSIDFSFQRRGAAHW
ncbi:hypothetical protein DFH06DRAFT_484201 [Mycena polygramma]|nr:hypothetical protein DFH06DRAFT_484201 [Mycena polygramma]